MAGRRMSRRESQERTRANLVGAAARVFARRGYDGASVAEIADEAGYSHGAVYSNFQGKEDLFLALYEQWVASRVAEIEAGWAEQASLAERARAAADEWIERFGRDPEAFLLRLEFSTRAARDSSLRRHLAERAGAVPLAIERLVKDAAYAEGSELALPPAEVARALQALSLGLALEALSDTAAVRPGLAGDLAAFVVQAVTAPRAANAR